MNFIYAPKKILSTIALGVTLLSSFGNSAFAALSLNNGDFSDHTGLTQEGAWYHGIPASWTVAGPNLYIINDTTLNLDGKGVVAQNLGTVEAGNEVVTVSFQYGDMWNGGYYAVGENMMTVELYDTTTNTSVATKTVQNTGSYGSLVSDSLTATSTVGDTLEVRFSSLAGTGVTPGSAAALDTVMLSTAALPDTTAPVLSNVSSDTVDGTYTAGDIIDIDLTFSEPVTSTGLTLDLNSGGSCTVPAIANSNTATCDYTIGVMHNADPLSISSVTGTITDTSTNETIDPTPTTNLESGHAIIVHNAVIAPNTVVVMPTSPWLFTETEGTGTGSYALAPTPPLGMGAFRMTVNNSNASYYIGSPDRNGTLISDIAQLSYSTYRVSGDPAVVPTLQINIDADATDANMGWQGRLVYEPYHSQDVLTGVWKTWNTLDDAAGTGTGNWWFSNGGLATSTGCSMANPCTWTEVKTQLPNAAIHSTLGLIGFKAGKGWGSFDGFIDNLNIAVASTGTDTTYDFEAGPTPPSLTEVTPVPTPSTDTTPDYVFHSNEAGTITYGGDCSSDTTEAIAGDNTITFDTLAVGVHNNCTITVTDVDTMSSTLNVTSFQINPAPNTVIVNSTSVNWAHNADGSSAPGTGSYAEIPTAPLGTGAFQMTLQNSGNSAYYFGTSLYNSTPLSDISKLSYSTYRTSIDANNNLAIALQLNVDYDATDASGTWQGRLVYEPYFSPATVTQDTWQNWDTLAGKWWMSGNAVVAGVNVGKACPQSAPCTWTALKAAYPNASISSALGFKAGSSWPAFSGYIDNLNIALNSTGTDTTYDFEYDITSPSVSSVSIQSNGTDTSFAGAGQTITVSFTTDEAIQDATVTIAGKTATVNHIEGNYYTASYEVTSSETQGIAAIVITFTDLSGNTSVHTSTTDESSVFIDTVSPEMPSLISPINGAYYAGAEGDELLWTEVDTEDEGASMVTYMIEISSSDNQTEDGQFTEMVMSSGSDTPSYEFSSPADGVYYWHVKAIDVIGNESDWSEVGSFTVDNTAPVITLIGDATVTVSQGSTYADAGATATDGESSLTVYREEEEPAVNTSIVGDYTVTWYADDTAGNTGSVVRIVHVVPVVPPSEGGGSSGGGGVILPSQLLNVNNPPATIHTTPADTYRIHLTPNPPASNALDSTPLTSSPTQSGSTGLVPSSTNRPATNSQNPSNNNVPNSDNTSGNTGSSSSEITSPENPSDKSPTVQSGENPNTPTTVDQGGGVTPEQNNHTLIWVLITILLLLNGWWFFVRKGPQGN